MKSTFLSFVISISLALYPLKAFAHGTEEEHASETAANYWSYGFGISLLLLVVFVILFLFTKSRMQKLDVKNSANRQKRNTMAKRNGLYKWGMALAAVLAVFFVIMMNVNGEEAGEAVTFQHIHGLGYTSDGEKLFVPAHDGLRVYQDGSWMTSDKGEKHDYMGFSMYEDGFYSSGHPAPGSDLANPLGIVKSTDEGETIERLDLYEEIDFHGMTVGYETGAIYVFNPQQNSRMNEPGFYYSTDETETWNQSELQGLAGQASALAAHPTEAGTVALGTDQGIFLSNDYGNSFDGLSVSDPVSALSFGHHNSLLAATQADSTKLFQVDLSNNEANELNVPDLEDDVIMYIQQNPVKEEELVLATQQRDIYFSYDGGETWEISVEEGVAVQHH